MCAPLGAASVQAFCQLQGLTALHLPGCDLHSLPDGPYLSSLIRCAGLEGVPKVLRCSGTALRGAARPRVLMIDAWPLPCCRSLDIAFNPLPASPIPFAVTAALGLCALYINGPEQDWEAADWLDLEWKLHCFKRLEVRSQRAS